MIVDLNNKEYSDTDTYEMYLMENELDPNEEYIKATMQKRLLQTVYNIFQALANNIDLFRKIETELTTTSDAYKSLQLRINDIEKQINAIPDPDNTLSQISFLFYS